MAVRPLTAAPNRREPETFDDLADPYVDSMEGFSEDVVQLASQLDSSVATVLAAVGATIWASGSFVTGTLKVSPTNGRIYVRKSPGGSSPTDPAADPTNWALRSLGVPPRTTVSGTSQALISGGRYSFVNAAQSTGVGPASPTTDDFLFLAWDNGRVDNKFDGNGVLVLGYSILTIDWPYHAALWIYDGAPLGWRPYAL